MSWNPTTSVPRLSLLVAPPPLGPRSLIRIASGRWEGPLSMARTAGCGPKATATQRLAVGEGDDQYFRLGRRLEAATSAPARRPHPTRPAQLGPTAGSRRPAAAGGPPAPSTRPPSWPATWAVGWTMVFAECPSGTLRCPPPPPARKTRWRLQRPNTQWWPAARIPRALSCGGARGPAALNGHLDRVMDFFPRTSSFALFCATLYVNGPPPGQSSLSSAVIQEVRQDARAASVAHASTTAACLGQSLAVKACMELGGGGGQLDADTGCRQSCPNKGLWWGANKTRLCPSFELCASRFRRRGTCVCWPPESQVLPGRARCPRPLDMTIGTEVLWLWGTRTGGTPPPEQVTTELDVCTPLPPPALANGRPRRHQQSGIPAVGAHTSPSRGDGGGGGGKRALLAGYALQLPPRHERMNSEVAAAAPPAAASSRRVRPAAVVATRAQCAAGRQRVGVSATASPSRRPCPNRGPRD